MLRIRTALCIVISVFFVGGLLALNYADAANPLFRISGSVTAGHVVALQTPYVGIDGGAPVTANSAAVSHQFVTGTNSGSFLRAQPACGDLSNGAASCSTDTTNAANISSGTLPAARLPNPSASTLGGVQSLVATSHQWINTISTSGIPASTQPAFTDVTGTLAAAQVAPATITGQTLNSTPNTATDFLFYFNATDNAVRKINIANLISSGVAGVSSFNGRTGVVLPTTGDYNFNQLSGSVACAQLPALTGDVTTTAGTCATALVNIPNATTAAGDIIWAATVAPGTPAAGNAAVYVDSTSKNIAIKNDAGVVNHGVQTLASVSHKYLTAVADNGAVTAAQPACGDLSNAAASCSTDTTNAANISSGTLPAARLPNPSASTLGGVQSLAATSHQWINTISTSGIPASTQPAFTDVAGTLAGSQLPALSGDVSNSGAVVTVTQIQGNPVASGSPGASGNILVWNGTQWAGTTVSSGGLVKISTQVASASASLQWTGLGTTFINYKLTCSGIVQGTASAAHLIQVGEGATPTWQTSGYRWAGTLRTDGGTTVTGKVDTGAIGFDMLAASSFGATVSQQSYVAELSNIPGTNNVLMQGATEAYNGVSNSQYINLGGVFTTDTNPKTAIRLILSTGTITSGSCTLYGYNP